MTYPESLHFLFTKLPMYSRIGQAAHKNSLDNIISLCEQIGNPQNNFKSIHVAGTNGKGSVSHMLAAILQASGYKTALYTSPHLYDFRERIKINGVMVPEDFVVQFVEKIKPCIAQMDASFFEITVAMAFDYFAQEAVDIAIIEVGLGGRLDSTNIINPLLSIITNIGFDHTQILGNTLPLIAAEKGGIIKKETPVVIGERGEETDPVFIQIAENKKAPIYFSEDFFRVVSFQSNATSIDLEIKNNTLESIEKYTIDLPGIYQTKNILPVLQTVSLLQSVGFPIDSPSLHYGLSHVKKSTGLWGRWDVLQINPTLVLEVAHNEGGMNQMLAHLATLHYNQLHLIFGTVKDKDVTNLLELLPKDASFYFTQAHIPRALAAQNLQALAAALSLIGDVFENVNDAIVAAKKIAKKEDLIIVCGSIFLVAEVTKKDFV